MKHIYKSLVLALVGMFVMHSCSAQIADKETLRKVAASDSVLLIDVRTVAEYEEGHINGSVNIPLDTIRNSVEDISQFKKVIVVCRSGKRSATAKEILEKEGLKEIYNGGGWSSLNEILNGEK